MIQKKHNNHRNEQAHVKKYYVHFKYHIIRATQVTLPLLGISVYIVFVSLCVWWFSCPIVVVMPHIQHYWMLRCLLYMLLRCLLYWLLWCSLLCHTFSIIGCLLYSVLLKQFIYICCVSNLLFQNISAVTTCILESF